jgi:molybdenum cofactor cytidylyltransferase
MLEACVRKAGAPDSGIVKTQPTVIVLAAGRGSRFEGPIHKLAHMFGETSLLGATLDKVLSSRLPLLVVTTAPMLPDVARVVARRDIVVLPEVGARPELGVGHSIASGVAARSDAGGWLILPGDMPMVRSSTLLAVAQALDQYPIAFAQYRGRRGHPVGFSAELLPDLMQLTGDVGAQRLLARYPTHAVLVDDPGVLVDVDTQDDLRAINPAALAAAQPVTRG